MKEFNFKWKSITFILLCLLSFSSFAQIVWASDQHNILSTEQKEIQDIKSLDSVHIYYDPFDPDMKYIAFSIYDLLSYRLLNLQLLPITNVGDLKEKLNKEPWIAIYALDCGVSSVKLPKEEISWSRFNQLINSYYTTEHIIGTSNTFSLERLDTKISSHIHLSESEQVDRKILIMYDLWTTAKIAMKRAESDLNYNQTAQDLQAIGLQLYADNFNVLFQAQLDPQDPVGEVDKNALEHRTQAMYDRHQPKISPAAYHLEEDGSLTEIDYDTVSENSSAAIRLSPSDQIGPEDFILGNIPLLSGLNGPIGEIVDLLLNLLGDGGSTLLSIPKSVMESIKGSFTQIQDVIGLVTDFDAESILKTLLSVLSDQFPFLEEFKPFL